MKRSISRALAAALSAALILLSPGNAAWAAFASSLPAARSARPASGAHARAAVPRAAGPAAAFSRAGILPPLPALPALPAVRSAARAPLALAARRQAPAPAARDARRAAVLAASSRAGRPPSAPEMEPRSWARWSAVFDGLAMSAAPDPGESGGAATGRPGSGGPRFSGARALVTVTVRAEGPAEAAAAWERLAREHGFVLDEARLPAPAERGYTARGSVPADRVRALASDPEVLGLSVEGSEGGRTVPAYRAPGGESLFRALVRSAAIKNRARTALLLSPLYAFAAAALVVPALAAVAVTSPPAALSLAPFLLLGTAATASFALFPGVFPSILPRSRAAFGYLLLAGGGALLALIGGPVPGIWAAANAGAALLALWRPGAFPDSRSLTGAHPVDRLVGSAELALHISLIGLQLLSLTWSLTSLPGAALILALGSAATALLLARAKGGPEGAASGPGSGGPVSPRAGPREPFVPASRKVAALEALARMDAPAAAAAAAAALEDESDRRPEVKIGALRVLDSLPLRSVAGSLLLYLQARAAPETQAAKAAGHDPWWYIQREMLGRLLREADPAVPAHPELLAVVEASASDANASVALMARALLAKLGGPSGPRPGPASTGGSVPSVSRGDDGPAAPPAASGRPSRSAVSRWTAGLLLASLLGLAAPLGPGAAAEQPPAAVQPADPAALQDIERQTLEELRRTREALERAADSQEKAAQAIERATQPRNGGPMGMVWSLLLAFGPIVFFIWLFRRMQGGGGRGPGAVGALNASADKPSVRFDDVAGIDESMIEIEEIADYLRDPERFSRLGAKAPKGVLLEGPPGTGKTLLAKALAGETDAHFFPISGSDFVEVYVGVGAARVRSLFTQAKAKRPAVIFIDEIDAVGKKRGSGGLSGGNDEREQTINQLLKEMDGFGDSSGIIVVAATNRIDTLDDALVRPGRFDRKVHVGLPDMAGREAILALHARRVRLDPGADLRYVARRTAGMSGAFLENVVQEAARLAARRGGDAVTQADLDEGVDRASIGAKRSLKLSDALKRRVAFHESGHVLANLLNERPELRVPVNKVTIIPHGTGALGFAESGASEGDRYLQTQSELEARLDVAVGGLVAEKLVFGEWSTGPGSDLEHATRVARAMVQQLGMDPSLGLAQTAPDPGDPFGRPPFGEAAAGRAHEAVNRLLREAFARVERRLTAHRAVLDAMAGSLLEKETLIDSEIEAVVRAAR